MVPKLDAVGDYTCGRLKTLNPKFREMVCLNF